MSSCVLEKLPLSWKNVHEIPVAASFVDEFDAISQVIAELVKCQQNVRSNVVI